MKDKPEGYAHLTAKIDQLKSELAKAQAEIVRLNVKAYAEIAKAVAKERERCAWVCEYRGTFNSMYAHHILTGAAEAIRKGEKESLTVEARKPVPEFELIEKWEGE